MLKWVTVFSAYVNSFIVPYKVCTVLKKAKYYSVQTCVEVKRHSKLLSSSFMLRWFFITDSNKATRSASRSDFSIRITRPGNIWYADPPKFNVHVFIYIKQWTIFFLICLVSINMLQCVHPISILFKAEKEEKSLL